MPKICKKFAETLDSLSAKHLLEIYKGNQRTLF